MEKDNTNSDQSIKYVCDKCEYSTDRHYNLIRHSQRIHEEQKKKKICCGQIFENKGDYYFHIEAHHPNRRKNAVISRNLYKIGNEMKFEYKIPKESIPKFERDFLDYISDIDFDKLREQHSNKSNK